MFKILKVISSVIIPALMFGCKTNKGIDEYDLNTIFKAIIKSTKLHKAKIKVDMCSTIPFDWDKAVVIPTYTPNKEIRKLELINSEELNGELSNFYSDEGNRVLAFIKDSKVVRISIVPSTLVDLNTLVKEGDYLAVLSKIDFCENLYFRNVDNAIVIASLEP